MTTESADGNKAWRLFWISTDKTDEDQQAGPAYTPHHSNITRVDTAKYPEYYASEEVVEAVNTAVSLGKPLLVAGEPGVGKTQLANFIARSFGLLDRDGNPEVFRFDVKSNTKGADLIYRYDAIRHFRDSNLENLKKKKEDDQSESNESGSGADRSGDEKSDPKTEAHPYREYVELSELGIGIALGNGLEHDYGDADLNAVAREAIEDLLASDKPRVSVVLIDEIDKAPRDVPNDLLREIDEMSGRIPELGRNAFLTAPGRDTRPIVVITTNDERALPDAFLRRCCFLHIGFPDIGSKEGRKSIIRIVRARLAESWPGDTLAGAAISLVRDLRKDNLLSKKPTTAELIDFISEMHVRLKADGAANAGDVDFMATARHREIAERTAITVYAKSADDDDKIKKLFQRKPDQPD